MDENFNQSLKFHHLTSTEKSSFASSGTLLTLWSLQVLAHLSFSWGYLASRG